MDDEPFDFEDSENIPVYTLLWYLDFLSRMSDINII